MSWFVKYRKTWVAILTAALTAAQAGLPLTDTQHAWVAVALTVLGAVAVRQVPNEPAGAPQAGAHR